MNDPNIRRQDKSPPRTGDDLADLRSLLLSPEQVDLAKLKERLDDPHGVVAECPKPDDTQSLVFESHGLFGSPLQVGEDLQVHIEDLDPEGALEAEGKAQRLGQQGQILGGQGMPSGAENIISLPIPEETAAWFSRTTSWAPNLISADPVSGIRWTISRPDSSNHSMTSKN
jgi:hypothetical protein